MEFKLHSLEDTKQFARETALLCWTRHVIITLDGDLGAGKTTWTRFFGQALGIEETINSPTFTIMKSYTQADGNPFYHIDAYRLEGTHQDLGFEDCFDEGICVVEWAQYIADQIPEDHISITFEQGMEEERTVTVQGHGPVSQEIVEAMG
ncbi:MAG: tRNA (adenosine(37)-N6)-threonylcarbamoyltransferase complex ATPase subunit type 1 TsaE [Erysipelotrichaceae bacterium]|nr:tRNA (adenosine(37)-N6)-threonylcarbamoyltransferase complex ATPase subunit type 1 TsaE [Erysipelotrichaceae bacterium]